MAEAEASRRAPGWRSRLIQVLCLIFAAFVIFEEVQQVLWHLPTPLTAQTEVERFATLAAELRQENATLRSLIPQRA